MEKKKLTPEEARKLKIQSKLKLDSKSIKDHGNGKRN